MRLNSRYAPGADPRSSARADQTPTLALTLDVLRRGGIASFRAHHALPEYYPTRTERGILAKHADAIMTAAHGDRSLPLRIVELGVGTAAKTVILLEAALRVSDDVSYMPVDVSAEALELATKTSHALCREVRTQPVIRNYIAHPLQLESFDGTTLALYIGSNIGNFSPKKRG